MSYQFHSIASKVDLRTMLSALKQAAENLRGSYNDSSYDEAPKDGSQKYEVFESKGWTVCLGEEPGIIPAFVVEVSKLLPQEVIGFDVLEAIGYEHILILDKGRALKLYTFLDGELDNEGIDWEKDSEAVLKQGLIPQPIIGNAQEELLHRPRILLQLYSDYNIDEQVPLGEVEPVHIWLPIQFPTLLDARKSFRELTNETGKTVVRVRKIPRSRISEIEKAD